MNDVILISDVAEFILAKVGWESENSWEIVKPGLSKCDAE